jgi:hypothetical protein
MKGILIRNRCHGGRSRIEMSDIKWKRVGRRKLGRELGTSRFMRMPMGAGKGR